MKNDGLVFLKAYSARKLGNLQGPYRVYEMVTDEVNSLGKVLIWNVNSFDFQIFTTEVNPINLLQEETPERFIEILKGMK